MYMGILEFLVATIPVVMALSIPFYAIGRTFNQKDKKLALRELEEKKELERLKQENFVLENKQMQIELDKLKKERAIIDAKNDRWLIEESREEERT